MTLVASEHAEQAALFQMAELHVSRYPVLKLLYAIPNGGHRHYVVAAKLKAEGVKRGVPDVCLPAARRGYHGLYIEMKRTEGGTVAEHQGEWIAALTAEGYLAVVREGWDAAWITLVEYIKGEKTKL